MEAHGGVQCACCVKSSQMLFRVACWFPGVVNIPVCQKTLKSRPKMRVLTQSKRMSTLFLVLTCMEQVQY